MKLHTIKSAIQFLNRKMQIDPEVHGKDSISRQTIYNAVHRGELTRHGPRHILQLDEKELVARFVR